MTGIASSSLALGVASEERVAARRALKRELEKMSETMVEEKGLLNHAQAALLLNVSTKRVGELVRLGKLSRFDFAGRTYVSMREIWQRNQETLKAGRPIRSGVRRAAASLKAAANHDMLQIRLGGFAGPYHKLKERERKAKLIEDRIKRREKYRAKWRELRDAHKK
jgi:hypothetical protein